SRRARSERRLTEEPSFEELERELEAIVSRLEQGKVALDEAIALWERGEELYRLCVGRLDLAQGRIEELSTRIDSARPAEAPSGDASLWGQARASPRPCPAGPRRASTRKEPGDDWPGGVPEGHGWTADVWGQTLPWPLQPRPARACPSANRSSRARVGSPERSSRAEKSSQRTFASRQRRTTSPVALPAQVVSSTAPSPVTTRSAPRGSKPRRSSTSGAP